jgi:hypothetical protein
MFAQVLGEENLGTDASLSFSAKCGQKLEPGRYKLTGMLAAHPDPLAAKIDIYIR